MFLRSTKFTGPIPSSVFRNNMKQLQAFGVLFYVINNRQLTDNETLVLNVTKEDIVNTFATDELVQRIVNDHKCLQAFFPEKAKARKNRK